MYKILYENPNEDIFTRLLNIRKIDDNIDDFLNPTFVKYRQDPFLLEWMDSATKRVISAIENKEKIMIFGDYDADWISSSFVIYKFFTKFLNYKKISIRLPNRIKDGYWIKNHHIDEIKDLWVTLIITVDNWITAVNEVLYAKKLGIDMIITDHHKALEKLPDALSIINPQISNTFTSKELAWVWVAFKFISALSSKLINNIETKQKILNYFLPIVAIWTVWDCVPLINENRLLVKKWLELLTSKDWIPTSVKNLLKFLNINKEVSTFHIGFMIAPRLNAWWRIVDPIESLKCLLNSDEQTQFPMLESLELLNTQRKKTEDIMLKLANEQVDSNKKIIIVASEEFHEWIVWLIAWRLWEKHYKPTIVLTIKKDEWIAVWSLRWPDYFDIVNMLKVADWYLERYWWHKQAWWLTVKLENLDTVFKIFEDYANNNIPDNIQRIIEVDTKIYDNEINTNSLEKIHLLAPFGEWNQEPLFLIDNVNIGSVEKVWKNWNWHMKMHWSKNWQKFQIMLRWKWSEINWIDKNISKKIIWKVKKDDFNWGFFIDWNNIIDEN